jgi:hypothetical protein
MALALFWVVACGIAHTEAQGEYGFIAATTLECFLACISAIFMIGSSDRDVTCILNLVAVSVSLAGVILTWMINSRYFFAGIFAYGIIIISTDIACQIAISSIKISEVAPRTIWILPLIAILMSMVRALYISVVIARTTRLTADDKAVYDAIWLQLVADDKNLECIHRIQECVRAWEVDGLEFIPACTGAACTAPPENVCTGREGSCLRATIAYLQENKMEGRDENHNQELDQKRSFKPSSPVATDLDRLERTRVPRQCNRRRQKHQSANASITASKLTPLSSILVEMMGGPGKPGEMDPRNPVTSIDQLYAQAQGIQWFFKHKLETWVAALRQTTGGVSSEAGEAGTLSTRIRFSDCIKSPVR